MGYGVNLFGHAPAFVWEAVQETVERLGLHIAFPHRLAGEVAELVATLVPGVEQLRFAISGTEATQAAVRLARAATGRDLVLKFEGHYHGWADHLGAGSGPASATRPARPDSAGVPRSAMESLWTVPWNDEAALDEALDAAGDRVAAVICEVVPGSGGVLEPRPGFSSTCARCARARCAGRLRRGDDRFSPPPAAPRSSTASRRTSRRSARSSARGWLAAFGGSGELMRWEAENRVVHGGTTTGLGRPRLGGRPAIASPARRASYDELRAALGAPRGGIEAGFGGRRPGHVRRVGSMLQPVLAARPSLAPRDVNEAAALQPVALYTAFCDELERQGVYAHRYALGRWFVSLAHGHEEIEATIGAAERAAVALAGALD
jgi:glutamate-1-semialdehyde 2,1-aminomutase